MDIKIILSADDKALEFARHLGKVFGAYVSQSDIEAGLCGKITNKVVATLEPDTMPWEDEIEKGRAYADAAQKAAETAAAKAIEEHKANTDPVPAAQKEPDYISHEDLQRKCVDLGDAYGQPAFQELKKKAGFVSMKKLDPAGRQKFADLIDQYIADHPKGYANAR